MSRTCTGIVQSRSSTRSSRHVSLTGRHNKQASSQRTNSGRKAESFHICTDRVRSLKDLLFFLEELLG